jgi:iron complex outermembrane recepter protein
MVIQRYRCRLRVGIVTAGLLASMTTAFAATSPAATGSAASAAADVPAPSADTAPTVEEVVVTGSRIAAPNETSTSAIQVVTSKEFEEGGKRDVIDLLNQLPQNFQNAMTDFSNTSSGLTTPGGISTANLRGIGTQRTLVLVNGRRLGVGDPNTANPNSSPDLDQIPVGLIDRVDVVTGGASSAYGSDALAGVVNFIMKKDFEGVQLDGQLGQYWHHNHEKWVQDLQAAQDFDVVSGTKHDGRRRSFNLLMGANLADGRGNVTAYLGYLQANPVASAERDFGGCQLNLNDDGRGVSCGGSQNSNFFQYPSTAYSVLGNQFVPYPHRGSIPPPEFNSQRYIYMSRGDERYNAGLQAHIDINDMVKPYAEFGFMQDKTTLIIAPSGLFQSNPLDPTGNGRFSINCSNPLLSAQEAAILCTPAQIAADAANPGSVSADVNIGRRNVEGGGRVGFFDHTNYRAVAGATGKLAGAWTYDAYGQYYNTVLFNSNSKYLSFQSVGNALQVTGTADHPVCIHDSGSCVPWNIFQAGAVTQDQLAYLYASGTARGTSTERTLHVDVTGDLGAYGLRSPFATDALGINVGFEHRNDHLSFEPDAAELSGLLSGFGGASVSVDNSVSVDEEFVEVRAPLAQDRTGIKDLVFDTGFRHSKYSLAGGVNTYKFEVQYAPIADIRLRASYQRAIRAPNVIELFSPSSFGVNGAVPIDPCAPTFNTDTGQLIPATRSLADCTRTGVTPQQYGNGGTTNTITQCSGLQCGQLLGGNTALKPETSDSVDIGFNFDPGFAPGLTGSVDYYYIRVRDEIGPQSAPIILQRCLDTGDPYYCNLIVRTPGGSLSGSSVSSGGYIVQTNVNIGAASVAGVDVQAAYRLALPPGWGSVGFAFTGSQLIKQTTTPFPGAHTYNCVALFGQSCATVNPRWRHNLRLTWESPWNVELSAMWRFIGAVSLDSNTSDPTLSNGGYDAFDARMPNISYLDLSAAWKIMRGVQIRAGVNNLFDKDPPIVSANVAAGGAANSYPTYDQLGRELFVAFTLRY